MQAGMSFFRPARAQKRAAQRHERRIAKRLDRQARGPLMGACHTKVMAAILEGVYDREAWG